MSNGADGYNQSLIQSLPVWARVMVIFGPTFTFGCAMLAALLGWIDSPMSQSLKQNEVMIRTLQTHEYNSSQLRREMLSTLDYGNMILRSICRNQVPSQAQFQCEPRYRGWEEQREKENNR